ncbi:hypothetical protein ACIQI7_05630 [Kitasatospora sp. NPDC092039]|uniref:hypothetical protein n=1 Tax=Kitasatospora sp. NPDC092039 TaxID=3364086 RepID=UPI003803C24F
MTTVTAVVDVEEPLERTVRLLPAAWGRDRQGRGDQPEPLEPAPAADRERTRPAHCRFATHYED